MNDHCSNLYDSKYDRNKQLRISWRLDEMGMFSAILTICEWNLPVVVHLCGKYSVHCWILLMEGQWWGNLIFVMLFSWTSHRAIKTVELSLIWDTVAPMCIHCYTRSEGCSKSTTPCNKMFVWMIDFDVPMADTRRCIVKAYLAIENIHYFCIVLFRFDNINSFKRSPCNFKLAFESQTRSLLCIDTYKSINQDQVR